jgi:hypothetical protein
LRTIAFVGAWVFLCLALVSGTSRASMTSMAPTAEARPMVASAMPAAVMPQMLDCMPCAGCYVAPAPVAQGVSAEPGGTNEPAWRVHDPAQPDTTQTSNPGGWPPRLPVRIAYCRWLD